MTNISISLRLTIWFSTVFLCGFTIFGVVMWADLAVSLSQGRDRTLNRRATRALDLVAAALVEPPERGAAKYDEFADATPEGNLILVFDAGGQVLYPKISHAPPDFPWPKLDAIRADRYIDVPFHGLKYRVLQHPAALAGQNLRVVVGGQLADNRQMLGRFSTGLLWSIPMLLAASAFGGYFMSRRVLRPVDRLTASVRSINIGNLSERLPMRQTSDELQRLAETCNQMLARVEAAVVQIKRFTADASHELRSPLSYIHMVAEYALQNPKLEPESRESFAEILSESQDATHLLEDMLALARADAGQVDMRFEPTDLDALVAEVCEKARVPAEAKGHELLVLRAGCPCEVYGDPSSLRRLIWTLLDNAIKYTPSGGRVEVALERKGTEARLSVRDTGIGIAAHLLPRVFERFFRADPARSQVDGTGLGLSIAKWIAGIHHADLSVESEPGAGSIFTVVFLLDWSGPA